MLLDKSTVAVDSGNRIKSPRLRSCSSTVAGMFLFCGLAAITMICRILEADVNAVSFMLQVDGDADGDDGDDENGDGDGGDDDAHLLLLMIKMMVLATTMMVMLTVTMTAMMVLLDWQTWHLCSSGAGNKLSNSWNQEPHNRKYGRNCPIWVDSLGNTSATVLHATRKSS